MKEASKRGKPARPKGGSELFITFKGLLEASKEESFKPVQNKEE